MKSSKRNLFLIHRNAKKLRRYFSLQNALRNAVTLSIKEKIGVTVYDLDRGVDVVTATPRGGIIVHFPKRFNNLWLRVK